MDFLYNNIIINQIVDKLFRHRRVHYSQFHIDDLIDDLRIKHEIVQVINGFYEKLYVSIFRKQKDTEICIVCLHGYGSNRLECYNILQFLPQKYALCSFDFSGCGKSQGDMITYGMKEKQDIHFILNFLKRRGFNKFVLWGRSMGATSALLYTIKYQPKNIILLVLDSAFYSFKSIALDIANKHVKAPQFIISFALQMAKRNCIKFHHNPFQIQLKQVDKISIPSIFLYCQEDNVINARNTYAICSKYKAKYEKLILSQNHNTIRSDTTIKKILSFIDRYQIRDSHTIEQLNHQIKKNQVYSYDSIYKDKKILDKYVSSSNKIQYLPKKGIQRVNQIKKKQSQVNINQIDVVIDQIKMNYTANSKFVTPKFKRPHLSLQFRDQSTEKVRKSHFFRTETLKNKEKMQISSSFIHEMSLSNNSNKNMNKKIQLIQFSKFNHRNKLKILG